jgi:hypothetical protein
MSHIRTTNPRSFTADNYINSFSFGQRPIPSRHNRFENLIGSANQSMRRKEYEKEQIKILRNTRPELESRFFNGMDPQYYAQQGQEQFAKIMKSIEIAGKKIDLTYVVKRAVLENSPNLNLEFVDRVMKTKNFDVKSSQLVLEHIRQVLAGLHNDETSGDLMNVFTPTEERIISFGARG